MFLLFTGGRGGNGGGSISLKSLRSVVVTGLITVSGEDGQGDNIPTGGQYVLNYCGFIYFRGYQFSWIEQNLHFHEHLISWFCLSLQTSLWKICNSLNI